MAKRGKQSQSSSTKRNGRRRNYSQPEVKWAVGDENLDSLTSDMPKQFALSSGKETKSTSAFLIKDNDNASKGHALISDDKAATRYGNSDYVPRKSKSVPIAPTDTTAPTTRHKSKSPRHQPAEPSQAQVLPSERSPLDVSHAEVSRSEASAAQGSAGPTAPSDVIEGPVDPSVSIYAPDARTSSSASETTLDTPAYRHAGPHISESDAGPSLHPQETASQNSPFQDPKYNAFRRGSDIPSGVTTDATKATRAAYSQGAGTQDVYSRDINTRGAGAQIPEDRGILNAYLGLSGTRRAESVRHRLDKALDEWWEYSVLPSTALLRDGLLVLEAGHSLDEVHRTLLLRTSLAKRRGMVTAVGHQMDPDRSAFLIKDALLEQQHPFAVSDVSYLLTEGSSEPEWAELLLDELEHDYPQMPTDKQRTAQDVMALLRGQLGSSRTPDFQLDAIHRDAIYDVAVNGTKPQVAAPSTPDSVQVELSAPSYWNVGRIALVVLLAAALLTTWRWLQGRTTLTDMVVIPAGSYVVGNSASTYAERSVNIVNGYAIDRTEVINADYRLCYEQGTCSMPADISSATRQSYFLNPTFSSYPVIFVDWASADQYCAWAGKRLPSEDEWEIAATNAPATKRHYIYPWGDRFNRLYANSADSNLGDTQQAGSYYPSGTSSVGAEDMAGNVAEWTSTERSSDAYESYIIKGGSYLDTPELLWSSRNVPQPANFSSAWLGFRCAKPMEPQN